MLALKAVFLGALHGYGILLCIQQITGDGLNTSRAALPELYRLEAQGLLATESGASDNNRRAKYYSLTVPGRQTASRRRSWNRVSAAIAMALTARASRCEVLGHRFRAMFRAARGRESFETDLNDGIQFHPDRNKAAAVPDSQVSV